MAVSTAVPLRPPQLRSLAESGRESTSTSETLTEKAVDTVSPGKRHRKLLFRDRRSGNAKPEDVDRSASPSRPKTFLAALRSLLTMSPKQVDDFMASYLIYTLDWANEKQMVDTLGPNYAEKVGDCLKAYYGTLNALCSLGDVEKMYIPPLMDRQMSVRDNQLMYEESIARDIELKKGDHVLDLGCGRGRVAAHMSSFSGAVVTGLNIDPVSVAEARSYNSELGFQNSFVVKDFNDLPLPFADESFDAFYQIQALSLVKNIPALFKEVFRVLKPGAKLSSLDWVSLPAYNAESAEHRELMARVKPLIGAVGTPTPEILEDALVNAGFIVTRSDNASIDGLQAPLIDKVDVYFRGLRQLVLGLVKLHILPAHMKILLDRFCLDGQAFVEMDRKRLTTTSYRLIAIKPLKA